MANTMFSEGDLVVKEAQDGVLIGNTYLPWDKWDALAKTMHGRREAAKREKHGGREGMDPSHPDPVVLPPEGGAPSAGDPKAYPEPFRSAAEGDVTANQSAKRREDKTDDGKGRPAVDRLAPGHGPKDEQLVAEGQHAEHRRKTAAAREGLVEKK
jgi:hypothetical protein